MVTSNVQTDLSAMTCESECSSNEENNCDESDSEQLWDYNHSMKVMTPLKSALKKPGGEKYGKSVTFSATTVVYTDDAPEGFEEPMKGIELCLTFEPPPEYQDFEPVTEFRDSDSECDWFPVISVNQSTSNQEDSDDSDDQWDVLHGSDEDFGNVLSLNDVKLEDGFMDDSENSDSSQDTIILISQEEKPKEKGDLTNSCEKLDLFKDKCESKSNQIIDDEYQNAVTEDDTEEENDSSSSDTTDTVIEEDIEEFTNVVDIKHNDAETTEQIVDEVPYEEEEIYSKTSDIRKTIEESASRRTLLGGTEAKRRHSSYHPPRRLSNANCISEKLRWLACPDTLWDNEVTVPNDVREWKVETTARSDELEQFVEQYFTRIERIKKRYSLTDLGFVRNPSVRGIRPRFGSTTEILQQLQSQLHPHPLATNRTHHLTWPSRRNSYCGDIDLHGLKEERGVPEGASCSPAISSDPLYKDCDPANKGVIYYSLNV